MKNKEKFCERVWREKFVKENNFLYKESVFFFFSMKIVEKSFKKKS